MKQKSGKYFRWQEWWKVIFFAAIIVLGFISADVQPGEWYSHEVHPANWRNVPPVDYSTNAPCSEWYSGRHTKYFRKENVREFNAEPDTVTLGVDYYGFYYTSNYVAFKLPEAFQRIIADGHIVIVRCLHGRMVSLSVAS